MNSLVIALSIMLSLFPLCNKEKIKWNSISEFRIYNYSTFPDGKDISTFTNEDIGKMTYVEIDVGEAKEIFNKISFLGKRKFLWKGSFFATIKNKNGVQKRIKISTYGDHIMMDIETGFYYGFRREKDRKKWSEFIYKYLNQLRS